MNEYYKLHSGTRGAGKGAFMFPSELLKGLTINPEQLWDWNHIPGDDRPCQVCGSEPAKFIWLDDLKSTLCKRCFQEFKLDLEQTSLRGG